MVNRIKMFDLLLQGLLVAMTITLCTQRVLSRHTS